MKILVLMPEAQVTNTFFTPDVREKLESMGEVIWNKSSEHLNPDQIRDLLVDVDVCFTGWGTKCIDGYILEKANKLKIVAHTAGSVANYVNKDVYDKGIKVLSGNLEFAESVAESVIAYALCSLRDIPYYSGLVKDGGWRTPTFYNEGILDQTIGLVGFGMIAKQLVPMLKPFKNRIKVWARRLPQEVIDEYGIEPATLDEIFSTCKIISIHLAQVPETYHMIDKRLLQMIPEGSLFINTARGNVVDEQALIDELKTKRFKAALDVFEKEPLDPDSELRTLDNVLPIPHMGGPTIDRRRFVLLGLIDDIKKFFSGEEKLRHEIAYEHAMKMTGGKG